MTILIKKGLDLPISGVPDQKIQDGNSVQHVALLGDDYQGMKPTLAVETGGQVVLGQHLFTDKKNPGVKYTSPGCGKIVAINRGAKRKFVSIIIKLDGDDKKEFPCLDLNATDDIEQEWLRSILIDSGMWPCFRTRPYGKVPPVDTTPSSLFVTAMDTLPLAADPAVIIDEKKDDFVLGLKALSRLVPKLYLCVKNGTNIPGKDLSDVTVAEFDGPHPAGLPSTHIHFLDPINTKKNVWHIGYQDVMGVGHLLRTGTLSSERVIALAGPLMHTPRLVRTRIGASLTELCQNEVNKACRFISGSVLDGRHATENNGYLGRYHQQVCALAEGGGRGFLGWLSLGSDRFSSTSVFLSALFRNKLFNMGTAAWGGRRAIFPLGSYEKVMPLDIIATELLKSIATGNPEKAQELGCLEIVEEDLALCSFVCPGKNDFGPMLRQVLNDIEKEG